MKFIGSTLVVLGLLAPLSGAAEPKLRNRRLESANTDDGTCEAVGNNKGADCDVTRSALQTFPVSCVVSGSNKACVTCPASNCACKSTKGLCAGASSYQQAGDACYWGANGCYKSTITTDTADATTTADTTTVDPPAPGELGGFCRVEYSLKDTGNNGQKEFYSQHPQDKCTDKNSVCIPGDWDVVDADGYLSGTCETEQCHGKQKPGVIDEIDTNADNEATIRVTICHRTCSATNPWVRITIDDDAWGGVAASGCGHSLQHNVTEDCNIPAKEAQSGKTADEIWGVGRRVDYLLKNHGTRVDARINNGWPAPTKAGCDYGGNGCAGSYSQEEKDYWFYWERACPYVRHGDCCGSILTGACCGDNPYPHENIVIDTTKYACPTTADCSTVASIETECHDDVYNLPSTATDYKYCYIVENPGEHAICDIVVSDPLGDFTSALNDGDMVDGCLPPGNKVPAKEENPRTQLPPPEGETTDGCASGNPVIEEALPVSKCDHATVNPYVPDPAIEVWKTVGPSCRNEKDKELHVGKKGEDAKYCYKVANKGGSKLCNVELVDAGPNGSALPNGNFQHTFSSEPGMENGCLPVDGVVYLERPFTIEDDETNPAVVDGTSPDNEVVEDSDPATVQTIGISIEKKSSPGGCAVADMSELYVGQKGSDGSYCYEVENTGKATLCGIMITDMGYSMTLGTETPTMDGCLASGEKVTIERVITPLIANEDTTATVVGSHITESETVTDSDNSAVKVVDIHLEKTVTNGPGTCSLATTYEMWGGVTGEDLKYCFFVENMGPTTLCDIVLKDLDKAGNEYTVPVAGGDMSNGCLPPGGITFGDRLFPLPAGGEVTPATVTALPEGLDSPTVTATDDAGVMESQVEFNKVVVPATETCTVDMTEYEYLEVEAGVPVKFCYLITVPDTSGTPLCGIQVDDSNSASGEILSYDGSSMDGMVGCIEPGGTGVIPGSVISEVPDGGDNVPAILTGKPCAVCDDITVEDSAEVQVVGINLEKKVMLDSGDDCPNAASMGKLKETLTASAGAGLAYCYEMTNTGNVEICALALSDTEIEDAFDGTAITAGGDMSNGCLPPGGVVWYKMSFETPTDAEKFDAVVVGKTPAPSSTDLTDKDDAEVLLGSAGISIVKTVKTAGGECSVDMPGVPELVATEGTSLQYCYLIQNTGPNTLCNALLNDPNIGSPLSTAVGTSMDGKENCLAPDDSVYVTGPEFPNPPDGESETATASGDPVDGGDPVSASDDATIDASDILLKKYVTTDVTTPCKDQANMEDDTMTVPIGSDVKYCFASTNTGNVPLCSLKLSDLSELDGGSFSARVVTGDMNNGCLSKDSTVWTDGPTVRATKQDPSNDATVVGKPRNGDEISATDPAGLDVTPISASVDLKKYVTTELTVPCADQDNMEDDVMTVPLQSAVKYCYKITNTGEDNLCDVQLSDESVAKGFTVVTLTEADVTGVMPEGCIEKGDSVWVDGETFNAAEDDNFDATVSVKPEFNSDPRLTAKDPAGVQLPVEEIILPAGIALKKYVTTDATECANQSNMEDLELEIGEGDTAKYCYKVTNTAEDTLCSVLLADASAEAAITGITLTSENTVGDMSNGCLPAGGSAWFSGELIISTTDPSVDAVVTAVPENSDTPVSAKDPASVVLVVVDPVPPTPPGCVPMEDVVMGSGHCSTSEKAGVTLRNTVPSGYSAPVEFNPADIFYDIDPKTTTVSLKTRNPFGETMDMYIQYSAPSGAMSHSDCLMKKDVDECLPTNDSALEAVCQNLDKNPLAVVQVYFVDRDASLVLGDATVQECCQPDVPANAGVISYIFMIDCDCFSTQA